MLHAQVLIFETNRQCLELLSAILKLNGISHFPCPVPLRRGTVPPPIESFLAVLERHRPHLLITSWRHIGPVVKAVEKRMTGPRPIEKWIVSAYTTEQLDEFGVTGWASEIYEKPISPFIFAADVERRLKDIAARDQALLIH